MEAVQASTNNADADANTNSADATASCIATPDGTSPSNAPPSVPISTNTDTSNTREDLISSAKTGQDDASKTSNTLTCLLCEDDMVAAPHAALTTDKAQSTHTFDELDQSMAQNCASARYGLQLAANWSPPSHFQI